MEAHRAHRVKKIEHQHQNITTTMASLTASTTDTDREWMWSCDNRTLPPFFNPATSTTIPPLATTYDPLDLSEKRVQYHLERSRNLTPAPGDDLQALEHALTLFATLKETPSKEIGDEILRVLTDLNLHHFKEGGPLELASPNNCPERVLHYAQLNYESLDDSIAWSDQSTLEWAMYSLSCGDDAIAVTAMNLLSRIEDELTHETNRTSNEIFSMLHPLLIAASTMKRESPIFEFHPAVAASVANIATMESLTELKIWCKMYADTFDEVYEELYEQDEGEIFSVANCDECQAQLILPEFQQCENLHELHVHEVEDALHTCTYCKKAIQQGTLIRGCPLKECDFQLCQTCGGPWWHKIGCSDLCVHHYDDEGESGKSKSEGYVKVERKEDLGVEMEEYFDER